MRATFLNMVSDPEFLDRVVRVTEAAQQLNENVEGAIGVFLELLGPVYSQFARAVRPGEGGRPPLELFPGTNQPVPHGHRETPAVYMTAHGLDMVVAPYAKRGELVIYSNTDAVPQLRNALDRLSQYSSIPPREELEARVKERITDYIGTHLAVAVSYAAKTRADQMLKSLSDAAANAAAQDARAHAIG